LVSSIFIVNHNSEDNSEYNVMLSRPDMFHPVECLSEEDIINILGT